MSMFTPVDVFLYTLSLCSAIALFVGTAIGIVNLCIYLGDKKTIREYRKKKMLCPKCGSKLKKETECQ